VTVREALSEAYGLLSAGGVDTPVLDATVLLSEALGVSKERLFADLPEPLGDEAYAVFRRLLTRRLEGIPVSYIRKKKEFYGLEFLVDERVLVPRPETETLVESVLDLASGAPALRRLHDVCTGSGCIAIAVAHSLPALDVSVSDVSADALAVCALNARRLLGRELPSTPSDLLDAVVGRFDLITANPPYLTDREADELGARRWPEPRLALAGGPDGTAYLRRLIHGAREHLEPGGSLFVEIAPAQSVLLLPELAESGYERVRVIRDLSGRDRVITARLSAGGSP
jgi:release factor glutamine methyltransferase